MESFLFHKSQFPSPFYLLHVGLIATFHTMHSRYNQYPKVLTYFWRNQTFIRFHVCILCYGLQIASGIILFGRSPSLNVLPKSYTLMNIMIVLQDFKGCSVAHRHIVKLHEAVICLFRSLPLPTNGS